MNSDNKPTQQEIDRRAARLVNEDIYLCLSSLMSELIEASEETLEQVSELSYVT